MGNIQYFIFIAIAYVLCHGLTALLITPIQQDFLSDVTIFASLVYLPHGVRVLATWLWGWKAFFPLFAGACISAIIFTPADEQAIVRESLNISIAAGALSALLAFEAMRLLGRNFYAGGNTRIDWKGLLLIGAIASVINSVLQSVIYSGVILPEHATLTLVTYAIGDLIGLFVSMIALMIIFRWIRLSGRAG